MRTFIILSIAIIFVGCTAGYPLKSVDYYNLFNDRNSKVWVINELKLNGADMASGHVWHKDVMIFYESGKVDMTALKAIGHASPKRGSYYIDSQEKTIEIKFKDEVWHMDLDYLTEDSILMKPKKSSDVQFSVQIVPLPEL